MDTGGPRLPRETMPRFVLGMLAVLVGCAAVAEALWFSVYEEHARFVVLDLCSSGTTAVCLREQRDRVEWTLAFVPLVAAAGFIIALAASWWRRRSRVALPVHSLPGLVALNGCSAVAVGTHALPMMWKPSRPISAARADGLTSRYVEVGPNLLAMSISDPDRAGAILRHEYAHHRNSDVVIARWSVATSLVAAALTVWLVLEVWGDSFSGTMAVLLRAVLLLAVAGLARSGVLRAREFDADALAGATAADGNDGLTRALAVEQAIGSRWWSVVRSPFGHHPRAAVRVAMISDPVTLRRPRLTDAVLVGLTASLGAPVVARLVGDWAGSGMLRDYAAGIGWGGLGVALGCWLTVMLWANTVAGAGARAQGLLGFGITLALSVVIGNFVFSSTIVEDSVDLPLHVVDIESSILIAAVVPVGVVWIAQMLAEIHRRFPERSLFRGVPLLVACGCVATIGALVATVGYVHSQALLLGANADRLAALGVDADLPTTIASIATTWNQEWMAWLLPSLALAGGAIHVAARSRWRILVVPPAAAAVSVAVLWGTRELFDTTQRALDGGWFASGQAATLSPVIMGSAIASIVLVGVVNLESGRVVIAGFLAVISALLASLAAETFVLAGDGDAFGLVPDVMPIAVVAAMVLAALTGQGIMPRARRVAWGGVGVGVTALAVAAGVASVSARPSTEVDAGHYMVVLDEVLRNDDAGQSPAMAVLTECASEVKESTPSAAGEVVEQLRFAGFRPSTAELGNLHDDLISLVGLCGDSAQRALDGDQSVLSESDSRGLDARFTAFVEDLERLLPEYFTP